MSKQIRVMLASLLIVTGVAVFLPASYVSAGGAVYNPGFELGEDEIPWAWNLTGNATRVDTPPIYAGNWSARITQQGDTLTQWVVNASSSVTYETWGWVYVSGNVTGVIAVDFWNVTPEHQVQLSPTWHMSTTDTDGLYKQVGDRMRAPRLTNFARIRLLGVGWTDGAEEEVRFDDIGFWVPGGAYCFIATAAYGSPMAEEVEVLREFRDEYMLTNPVGRTLADLYYRVSPPMAAFIDDHPGLKPMVRMGLKPAIGMSTVAVSTGSAQKIGVLAGLALVSAAVALLATRRRGRRSHYC